MQIKWSPQSADKETQLAVIDDNTVEIDGEQYSFPTTIVQFDPTGPIMEAHRDATGALYVTVLRRYRELARPSWDDVQYHDYPAGAVK